MRMELCAIILLHFIKAALWDGIATNLHLHDMASEYGSGRKPRYTQASGPCSIPSGDEWVGGGG